MANEAKRAGRWLSHGVDGEHQRERRQGHGPSVPQRGLPQAVYGGQNDGVTAGLMP